MSSEDKVDEINGKVSYLWIIGLAFIFGFIGYCSHRIPLIETISSFWLFSLVLEIGGELTLLPIYIFEKFFEVLYNKKRGRLCQVLFGVLVVVFMLVSLLVGAKVARERSLQKEVNSDQDKPLSIVTIQNINCSESVSVKIRKYDDCEYLDANDFFKIYGYNSEFNFAFVEKVRGQNLSLLEMLRNPISSFFVIFVDRLEYSKYEFYYYTTTTPTINETNDPTSLPNIEPSIFTDEVLDTSTAFTVENVTFSEATGTKEENVTTNLNEIIVVINEILVKDKNGSVLCEKQEQAGITHLFQYGFSKGKTDEKRIKSTEQGYLLKSNGQAINYITYGNNEWERASVDEYVVEFSNDCVGIDDHGLAFKLEDINELRKMIYNEKQRSEGVKTQFCDGKVSVTLNDMEVELPIFLTTAEDRVLYHYKDEKNDIYFEFYRAGSSSNLMLLTNFSEGDKGRFKVQCEIMVQ